MAKFGYIFCLAVLVPLIIAYNSDRDILLTPDQSLQQPGKTIYFRAAGRMSAAPATGRQQRSHTHHSNNNGNDLVKNVERPSIPAAAKDADIQTAASAVAVPWEEPLKHAIYLVLNNKVNDVAIHPNTNNAQYHRDGGGGGGGGAGNVEVEQQQQPAASDTSADQFERNAINEAPYLRSSQHGRHPRFGDIIPLARGRLEGLAGAGRYALHEMDIQQCDQQRCAINDAIAANVSAVWTVEMVRHRNPAHGHASEFKLTVYPVKQKPLTADKRDVLPRSHHQKITSRTFVVRDRDYPLLFAGEQLPQASAPKATTATATLATKGPAKSTPTKRMERRTLDMFAGLTPTTFDDYRMPLQFNYNIGHGLGHGQQAGLNIGEYYADAGPTAPTGYHSSFSATPYHNLFATSTTPGHVRFPTADEGAGITGPSSVGGAGVGDFLERISTTPLTATHLHHHYYVNQLGGRHATKGAAIEKENLYDKAPGYEQHGHLQSLHEPTHYGHPSVHPTVSPNQPLHVHPQHYQLLTEHPQFGAHELTTPGFQGGHVTFGPAHHAVHHQQQHATEQLHLGNYYNQNEIPPQNYAHSYAPNHAFPVLGNIVHPRFNAPVQTQPPPFRANLQLVTENFSEPDPLYHLHQQHQQHVETAQPEPHAHLVHQPDTPQQPLTHQQQINVLQQHLNPHLLQLGYPGYAEHIPTGPQEYGRQQLQQQQIHHHPNSLDVIALNANGAPLGEPTPTSTGLSQATGYGYEVPTEQLHLDPAGNNASSYDKAQAEGSAPSAPSGPAEPQAPTTGQTTGADAPETPAPSGPAKNQRKKSKYPDSINAQLPPPDRDDDVTVPYVDSSSHVEQTSKETTGTGLGPKQNNRLGVVRLKPRRKEATTTTTSTTTTTTAQPRDTTTTTTEDSPFQPTAADRSGQSPGKRGRTRSGQFQPQKSTTEKPILKWMPKRTRVRVPNEFTSPAATAPAAQTTTLTAISSTSTSTTTSTASSVATATTDANASANAAITPTPDDVAEDEARTSISTSISVKVGDDPQVSDEEARQIYKGFLPTRLPSGSGVGSDQQLVQLTRGNLTAIATNTSGLHFYRADETGNNEVGGDEEEDQIARSILRHAQGV